MPGSKKLTRDDQKVWRRVAKTVETKRTDSHDDIELFSEIVSPPPIPKAQKKVTQTNSPAPKRRPPAYDKSAYQLDRQTDQRLIKGKLEIDAKLDLHGLTLARARSAFVSFVIAQHRLQSRCLLVVTGKGRHQSQDEFNRERSGVIRQSLPQWCRESELSNLVIKTSQATRRHGGNGAFYIYLRRHNII